MSKAFAYTTKTGKIISGDILESYATKTETKAQPVDGFENNYKKDELVKPLYNPASLARLLEMNTYHSRAVRTKARDIAGLGWQLNPTKENPSQTEKELILEFFNEQPDSMSTLLNRAFVDFEALGYAMLEMTRVNYDPTQPPAQLGHIPAHTMRAARDGKRFCQVRGNKKTWFKAAGGDYDVHSETGKIMELGTAPENMRATEVISFVNYTPRSDYYGLPDIVPAIGAIHGDISRRDYNIAFFENYGVPAYAVFVTGNFDPGELDEKGKSEFEKNIESHFEEIVNNPHSTLVLTIPSQGRENEVKVEIKPLSVDVKEASFRLYRQDNRDEVLAAHGVPPYRLGIAETGSLGGSTAEESTEIYKRSVVEPRQETIEGVINKLILVDGLGVNDWEFELNEIDNRDEKHDMDIAGQLFDRAAITPNQLITHFGERFGLEQSEHPAMDAHYLNGVPVDLDIDVAPEVEAALNSLYDKVSGVIKSEPDSGRNSEYVDILASLKTITGGAAAGRKKNKRAFK